MAQEFYILDVEASRRMDNALWWRPNNSGYTCSLERAGRYTAEQVAADRTYYDCDSTRAIPCEVAEAMARRVVDSSEIRENLARRGRSFLEEPAPA